MSKQNQRKHFTAEEMKIARKATPMFLEALGLKTTTNLSYQSYSNCIVVTIASFEELRKALRRAGFKAKWSENEGEEGNEKWYGFTHPDIPSGEVHVRKFRNEYCATLQLLA